MSLRAAPGPAYLLGAVFSPKGELQSLRFVGGCAPAQVSDPGGLVDSIPGGDEAIARASDFVRGLEHARSGQGS